MPRCRQQEKVEHLSWNWLSLLPHSLRDRIPPFSGPPLTLQTLHELAIVFSLFRLTKRQRLNQNTWGIRVIIHCPSWSQQKMTVLSAAHLTLLHLLSLWCLPSDRLILDKVRPLKLDIHSQISTFYQDIPSSHQQKKLHWWTLYEHVKHLLDNTLKKISTCGIFYPKEVGNVTAIALY